MTDGRPVSMDAAGRVTGWGQVRYTCAPRVEGAIEKLQYDLVCIKNLSLALDAYVTLETIKSPVMGRGA